MKEHIVAGFNISCVGDDRDYSIVHSKYADTLADRVLSNVLKSHTGGKYSDYSFLKRGSDKLWIGLWSPAWDVNITWPDSRLGLSPCLHL